MSKERVDIDAGCLLINAKTGPIKIAPSAIKMIDVCQMEDVIHHGDEEFHIVHCQHSFWLIGPFVDGALGAIEQLCSANPQIPLRRAVVESLPRKLRDPGLLRLRLFPIAGLGEFALSELPPLKILPEDDYV